jgi:hypothetical protein
MLLGEVLIKAGVISPDDLQQALKTQVHNAHLSFGEIITQLFGVPRHVIESHYINHALIPFIRAWLEKQLRHQVIGPGMSAADCLADITINIPSFSRYEGEVVSFERQSDGMYGESASLTKIEKIIATVDPLELTTTKGQKIIFNNVHLEVGLRDKGIRPDNPGFLSEVRLRLLQAVKGKE